MAGKANNSRAANAAPPPMGSNRSFGKASAAEAGVVLTVKVAVPGVVPVMLTGEVTEQVGAALPVVADTAQLSATEPVKPATGVTTMVETPLALGEAIRMAAVSARVIAGPPLMIASVARDGAYVASPEYWTVSTLVPARRIALFRFAVVEILAPDPVGRVAEPSKTPDAVKLIIPVGVPPAIVPVTVVVTTTAAWGEVEVLLAVAVVVVAMPPPVAIVSDCVTVPAA